MFKYILTLFETVLHFPPPASRLFTPSSVCFGDGLDKSKIDFLV